MFHKSRLLLMTAIALIANLPAASATQNDAQGWLNLTYQGHLSDHWLAWAEVQGRFGEDIGRLSQAIIRPGIGYEIRPGLSVWAGYARIESITAASKVGENRIWQQLIWVPGKLFDGTIISRTRLEERFAGNGNGTGWRVRQLLRYQRPFQAGGDLSLIATSETYLALSDTDWGARQGFDQVRNFLGVGFTAFSGARLVVGYLNQYINRIGPNERSNHILSVTLNGMF